MKNIDAFELFDCFVVGILVGDEQMHNTILLLVSKMCDAIQYNHCHVCLVFFVCLRSSTTISNKSTVAYHINRLRSGKWNVSCICIVQKYKKDF